MTKTFIETFDLKKTYKHLDGNITLFKDLTPSLCKHGSIKL